MKFKKGDIISQYNKDNEGLEVFELLEKFNRVNEEYSVRVITCEWDRSIEKKHFNFWTIFDNAVKHRLTKSPLYKLLKGI